jgi:hypothetical protein
MKVFYRLSPKPSVHEAKRPRYPFNKLRLSEFCLKSFVQGFSDTKPEILFLLDACPPEWQEMVKRTMTWDFKIENLHCADQNNSYLIQLDRAKNQNDLIWFQEDDYVYLKDVGQKIESALKELEFVSPYDHREFYMFNTDFHKGPFDIKLIDEQHWRTIDFNTMTWGCHSSKLIKYWDTLHLHGFWDRDTWDDMAKQGAKLWSPIPGLATHMHKDFLSPGIDWERRFRELD